MTSEAAGSIANMENSANTTESPGPKRERGASDAPTSDRMSFSGTSTSQHSPSQSDIVAVGPDHDHEGQSLHVDDASDDASSSSSSDSEGESPLHVFKNLLSTEEYQETLLEANENDLTRDELAALARLYHHFHPNFPRKRKRGDDVSGSWSIVCRLQQLNLPDFIQRYLERDPQRDPTLFLNDAVPLDSQNTIGQSTQRNEGEARSRGFISSLRYCKHAEYRGELDRARYLFAMLFFYDFIMNHYPGASGRVGPTMEQDIRTYLEQTNAKDLPFADTLKDLRKYSLRGKRLHYLCERFGTGALLILSMELSQNFLDNKFTLQGLSHDQAMLHLRELGLAEAAEDSGANELGDNVREQLRRQWDPQERV